jgi:transcriptional regulator with XRE-family HTH domain
MDGESARIVSNLKVVLKARGISYAQLARRIGLSEASVKRVLSRGTLSLRRLEQICAAIGSSVAELVQLLQPSGVAGRPDMLSLAQEKALASDPKLLACYHLVANGRTDGEIAAELRLSLAALRRHLATLRELGLVTQVSGRQTRARAAVAVRWRPDGPVSRVYEREVRAEFLQSLFGAEREALQFRTAELTPASCQILQRKLERLAADFRDLAELDGTVASDAKRNVGFLLAMRPWVWSRFANRSSRD